MSQFGSNIIRLIDCTFMTCTYQNVWRSHFVHNVNLLKKDHKKDQNCSLKASKD